MIIIYIILRYQHKSKNISIGNHAHSSPIREIVVLAIVKIGRGEAESNFNYYVYNYSLIGRECV